MNLLPGAGASTLLDRLTERLRARGRAPAGEEPPAAVLWTDPGREWESVVGLLRERLPELLTLGGYDPGFRRGPAIWLRWEVDGRRDDAEVPVLYLPGIRRRDLGSREECPELLKPLVELLHRGAVFRHPNGKDWTAAGFVRAAEGSGWTSPRTGAR